LVNDVAEMVGVAAAVLVVVLALVELVVELELEPHPATSAALAIKPSAIKPNGLRLTDAIRRRNPTFNMLAPPIREPSPLRSHNGFGVSMRLNGRPTFPPAHGHNPATCIGSCNVRGHIRGRGNPKRMIRARLD
jgi:hypothetical protein